MKLSTAIQKWVEKGLSKEEVETKARAAVKKAGGRWSKSTQAMLEGAFPASKKVMRPAGKDKAADKEKVELNVAIQLIMSKGRLPSKGTPPMVIKEAKRMFGKKFDETVKKVMEDPSFIKTINPKKADKPAEAPAAPAGGSGKGGKSTAISLYPLAQAMYRGLALAKRTYGTKSTFFPAKNKMCEYFFSHYNGLVSDMPLLKEMKSIISNDQGEVDKFLKSNGKSGKSKFEKGSTEAYIGALFELFLQWSKKGGKEKIKGGYQGVKMPQGGATVIGNRVLAVKAKNGDVACMMVSNKALKPTEAFAAALDAMKKYPVGKGESRIGVFPKINLKVNGEFKWMLDTFVGTSPDLNAAWKVFGCETENILKMDEVGAYIKSAVKVSMMTKGISRPPKEFRIESPFLFYVVRKGCHFPVFAAYLGKDSWVKGGK